MQINFLEEFVKYLGAGRNTSKLTIKNYKTDVARFIRWFENTFQTGLKPESVNSTIIQNYKTHLSEEAKLSQRSLERHLSSLRKFFSFLKAENFLIAEGIFPAHQKEKKEDPWNIQGFRQFLYNRSSSSLTIKNYITDINQFMPWAKAITTDNKAWQADEESLLNKINSNLVESYKDRLLKIGLSPLSVNRKLSAIRRFMEWNNLEAARVGNVSKQYIFDKKSFVESHKDEIQEFRTKKEAGRKYSGFPVFRFAQKTSNGFGFIFDHIFVIPLSSGFSAIAEFIWRKRGKSMFYKTLSPVKNPHLEVSNIGKTVYAPQYISTTYFPIHKKALFVLLHKRPKWYKRYHSYSTANYLHIAILFIFCALDVLFIYNKLNPTEPSASVLGIKTEEQARTFIFRAKLSDSNNIPITSPSDLRLSLYNSPDASGSALLWQDVVYHAIPDQNGNFTINLGGNKTLPQSIFSDNYNSYLGISVGTNAELLPRTQLPNTSLAKDAQTLSGLSPITNPDAKTSNVILALDSSGNLTIGGNANPTFSATGGEFKLSGQPLTLATNPGTSGDVLIKPDGSGMLDIQKPIHNSTNNNNAQTAIGAVEVDDLLSVLATSDAQSAFTVNQNGSGNLISAYTNSNAKFSIDSSGDAFFAGNVGIGTNTPIQSLDVKGNVMLSGTAPTIYLGPKNYIGFDTVNTNIYSTTGDITVHPATSSSFRPFTDNIYSLGTQNFRWSALRVGGGTSSFDGRLGVGTQNPYSQFSVLANADASVAATRITNLNTGDSAENVALMLALGTSSNSQNARFIQFVTGATSQNDGTGVGRIRSNGSSSGGAVAYESGAADFAEYFKKANPNETFDTGELVCLSQSGVTRCNGTNNSLVGVVSQTGAFIGNLPKEGTEQNFVVVGLTGQLPVKVSAENGPISVNDPIALSMLPGIGSKANSPGRIIGRAMESLNSGSLTITVFVQPSWYEGDLVQQIDSLSKSLIGTLQAGIIQTQSLFASSKIVSPIVEADQVHTNLISPVEQGSQISVRLNNSQFSILNSQFATGSAVATIDNKGNATFSGSLSSDSLNTGDASISGTLHAGTIIADNIIGPVQTSSQASSLQFPASGSASLSSITADTGQFNLGLISLGPSGFTDISVANQLSVGTNLVLSDNSISVLGNNLKIQPFATGSILFENGKIAMDTEGNLSVNGNAVFAKDVSINGKLSVNLISPVPNSDLVVNLPSSQIHNSEFIIHNSSNSAVFAIDQNGNINASGSATVKKLNISLVEPAFATSNVEAIATGSAGTAKILPHQTELTIKNPEVNAGSLIYVTPIGTPSGQTPFLVRQSEHDSFTVGIELPEFTDTNFNWLIIN